ncbi:MAG: hypothetical protein IKB04_09260, partial [Clostridia bacterium]|nr:hypothetical protein [Clostridia bacterium]
RRWRSMIAPTVILLRLWYHKIPTYTVVGAIIDRQHLQQQNIYATNFQPDCQPFCDFSCHIDKPEMFFERSRMTI